MNLQRWILWFIAQCLQYLWLFSVDGTLNSKIIAENSLNGIGHGVLEMQVTSQNLPGVAKDAAINLLGKTVLQPR